MALKPLTGQNVNVPYTGGVAGNNPVLGPTNFNPRQYDGSGVPSPGDLALYIVQNAPPGYTLDDIVRDVVDAGGSAEAVASLGGYFEREREGNAHEVNTRLQEAWAKAWREKRGTDQNTTYESAPPLPFDSPMVMQMRENAAKVNGSSSLSDTTYGTEQDVSSTKASITQKPLQGLFSSPKERETYGAGMSPIDIPSPMKNQSRLGPTAKETETYGNISDVGSGSANIAGHPLTVAFDDGSVADQKDAYNSPLAQGIYEAANALGIEPEVLATTISYETGGTFNPTKKGPTTKWGQHKGLIQFGEPQAKKHGVDWKNPLDSQLGPNGAVVSYLKAAGVTPGMGLLDVYSAINAGAPGLYDRSDAKAGGAPGTVRDKVEKQMAGHIKKAQDLFKDFAVKPTSPYGDIRPGGAPEYNTDIGVLSDIIAGPQHYTSTLDQNVVTSAGIEGVLNGGFDPVDPEKPTPVKTVPIVPQQTKLPGYEGSFDAASEYPAAKAPFIPNQNPPARAPIGGGSTSQPTDYSAHNQRMEEAATLEYQQGNMNRDPSYPHQDYGYRPDAYDPRGNQIGNTSGVNYGVGTNDFNVGAASQGYSPAVSSSGSGGNGNGVVSSNANLSGGRSAPSYTAPTTASLGGFQDAYKSAPVATKTTHFTPQTGYGPNPTDSVVAPQGGMVDAQYGGVLGEYEVPTADFAWGSPVKGVTPIGEKPQQTQTQTRSEPRRGNTYTNSPYATAETMSILNAGYNQASKPKASLGDKIGGIFENLLTKENMLNAAKGGLAGGIPGAAVGLFSNPVKQAISGGMSMGGSSVPNFSNYKQVPTAYDVYSDNSGQDVFGVANSGAVVSKDASSGWTTVTSNVNGKGPVSTTMIGGIAGGDSGNQAASKIVCTAMCEAYGFRENSWRNIVWLKYAKDNLTPHHEVGYHAIFKPLIKLGYDKNISPIRKILEHVAQHRSLDLRAKMRGTKRDTLGRFYRAILEPTCFGVGWLISKVKG